MSNRQHEIMDSSIYNEYMDGMDLAGYTNSLDKVGIYYDLVFYNNLYINKENHDLRFAVSPLSS